MCISKVSMIPLMFLFFISTANAATIFVNINAPGGNGASWGQAFNNLQSALNVASAGDQIWIAAGTYKPSIPNGGDPRLKTFSLPNNVELFGGFKGNEFSINQRNLDVNNTILSGDLNGDDIPISRPNYSDKIIDNAYHVVTAPGVSSTLDGLTIQSGNASVLNDYGGALHIQANSAIVINNSLFKNNTADKGGGAIYATGPNTSLTVTNCKFSFNKNTNPIVGDNGGGAIFGVSLAALNIDNSSFSNNFAGEDGGALRIDSSSGSITNSIFKSNEADHSAGAIVINNSFGDQALFHFAMNNLSLIDNVAHSFGGAIALLSPAGNRSNTVSIENSSFIGNKTTYKDDDVFRLGGDGGAIIMTDINTTIKNSVFVKNSAVNDGGAVAAVNFYESGFGAPTRTTINISDSLFNNNEALGAAPQLYTNLGLAFGLTFDRIYGGGAVFVGVGMIATIDNSEFNNNKALNGNGGAIMNGDLGSNIFPGFYLLADGTLNVSNSKFKNNTASANGGAISSHTIVPAGSLSFALMPSGATLSPLILSIIDSTFVSDNAVLGKGIYISQSINSTSTLNNNTFLAGDDVVTVP